MNKDTLHSIFVFSSVGSESLSEEYKSQVFKSWELKEFNSGCVVYEDKTKFPYNEYFKKTLYKTGFKFPNFFYFNDVYKIIENYEYICIIDDDLLFKQKNSIVETIDLMKKFNISLCSLSNSFEDKKSYYKIMQSTSDVKSIALTNFCEMGCMIFHKNLLELCKQEYMKNYHELKDYGFDFLVCSLASNFNYTIGIVKHLSFSNPMQPKRDTCKKDYEYYQNKINRIAPKIYENIVL